MYLEQIRNINHKAMQVDINLMYYVYLILVCVGACLTRQQWRHKLMITSSNRIAININKLKYLSKYYYILSQLDVKIM